MNAQKATPLVADPLVGRKRLIPYADFIRAVLARAGCAMTVIIQKYAGFSGQKLFRLAAVPSIVLSFAALTSAGGPECVAGSTYFNSSTMGQPLTWSLGQVNYYTLSSSRAVTNSGGYASIMLTLANFTANAQITACSDLETVLARPSTGTRWQPRY